MVTIWYCKRTFWRYISTTVFTIHSSLAGADAPLPLPRVATVCNATNTHCATTDPTLMKTKLFARASSTVLWSIDHYIRFFQISNDGQAILAQSDFANLAPRDATNDHVLFNIYRDGKAIQTVKLGALFESPAELRPTTSHLSWGHVEKIDADDNAVLSLVDGRTVAYSLITGLRVIK